MKKILSALIVTLMIFSVSMNVCAVADSTTIVECFDDGSYIETTIVLEEYVSTYATQVKKMQKSITGCLPAVWYKTTSLMKPLTLQM